MINLKKKKKMKEPEDKEIYTSMGILMELQGLDPLGNIESNFADDAINDIFDDMIDPYDALER
jgi:hypothetical protein